MALRYSLPSSECGGPIMRRAILFGFTITLFVVMACGDDTEQGGGDDEDDPNADEVDCPDTSEFDLFHDLPEDWMYFPDSDTFDHHRSLADEEASMDTLGATISDGVLQISLREEDGEEAIRLRLNLVVDEGPSLPGTFSLEESFSVTPEDDETFVRLSLVTNYLGPEPPCCHSTSSHYANSGDIEIDTCPTEVGQRLEGTFRDVTYYTVDDDGYLDGTFDVVLVETDDSIACTEDFDPGPC